VPFSLLGIGVATNGNLYVVEKAPSPSQSRIQLYDVSGGGALSLGILREFFPN